MCAFYIYRKQTLFSKERVSYKDSQGLQLTHRTQHAADQRHIRSALTFEMLLTHPYPIMTRHLPGIGSTPSWP
jgi:hypothetical protein